MTDFETWWPVAEARLHAMLRSMRVHRDAIDEVTQETAVRACANVFESERHLVAWCVVVARRIVYNDSRRASRQRAAAARHVPVIQDCVEDVVTAQLKREALLQVIERMTPERRMALQQQVAADRREAGRLAVARHRARMELRRIYDRLGVVVGSWRLRLALGLRFGTQGNESGSAATAVLGAALALITAATVAVSTIGPPAQGRTPPEAKTSSIQFQPRTAEAATEPSPPAATVARPSEPAPANGGTPAELRIDLGSDSHGHERSAEWRSPEPQEKDALYCSGEPGDPNYQCFTWPAAILGLGALISP